jgi:transcriptional regulator with XRE-family HTH domain
MASWKESRTKFWQKADALIAAGYSLPEIGRQIGVSHVAVHKYLKRSGKYEEWKEKKHAGKENKHAVLYSSRDKLIAQGLSMAEIAVREGVKLSSINRYIKQSGQREVWEENREKTLERHLENPFELGKGTERVILEAVRQYKTVNSFKISKHTLLERDVISSILRKHEIDYNSHHNQIPVPIVLDGPFQEKTSQCGSYTQKQRNMVLEIILDKDPITIHQLQEETGQEKETLLSILKDEQLVYLVPTSKINQIMNQRIIAGDTLEEIGAAGEVTRERARQYINATGQYDYWKEHRKRRKAEKSKQESEQENNLHQARQDLTNVLISRAYQKTDEGGWKYRRKALDYYYGGLKGKERKYKSKDVTTPLEKLCTLFETYEMAERLKVKLSLEELGERTGIWFPTIGRILKSKGLEPLYGARERSSPLSPEKVQAIERAYGSEFTSSDAAYFLGLSENHWVVACHFSEIRRSGAEKIKRKKYLFLAKQESFGTGMQKGDHLFYRTASQIYELDDLAQEEKTHFPDEEVAKLLEIRPECVEYARKQRWQIEYNLKRLLRVLYPERKGEKPYL